MITTEHIDKVPSKRKTLTIVLVIAILLVAGAGGWFYLHTKTISVHDIVPQERRVLTEEERQQIQQGLTEKTALSKKQSADVQKGLESTRTLTEEERQIMNNCT